MSEEQELNREQVKQIIASIAEEMDEETSEDELAFLIFKLMVREDADKLPADTGLEKVLAGVIQLLTVIIASHAATKAVVEGYEESDKIVDEIFGPMIREIGEAYGIMRLETAPLEES